MSTELIINASLPETRIALMEDGEIQELLIERASGKGIVGNIYKGRVTRVLPGMQAAFVDIGLEKAAFLYVDDVFVHSEIWNEEEGYAADAGVPPALDDAPSLDVELSPEDAPVHRGEEARPEGSSVDDSDEQLAQHMEDLEDEMEGSEDDEGSGEDDEEEDEDGGPVRMGPPPGEGNEGGEDGGDDSAQNQNPPEGTIAPPASESETPKFQIKKPPVSLDAQSGESEGAESFEGSEGASEGQSEGAGEGQSENGEDSRGGKRHRRGRRGGRHRKRGPGEKGGDRAPLEAGEGDAEGASEGRPSSERNVDGYPENYRDQFANHSDMESDRSAMSGSVESQLVVGEGSQYSGRPETEGLTGSMIMNQSSDHQERKAQEAPGGRAEFKEPRAKDRRIKAKTVAKPARGQAQIQNLLQEGQEVLVQVAKDPIATKGARLTCHISLPGRHLVCMPTIDHVGVSRRIEREDERRRLRDYVERYRPKNLGFIVRTASGKQQSEKRIKQDIEYLTRLWSEIREKTATVSAPALVYEDLNSVLRAIRDWVTEEIDRIVVDSRYHFNEIQRFVSHFMPSLKSKVELYNGDTPIFDAYNISTELSRAMERKVWLKSGGYLVIDQAEALVAIDVNTGRFVGKKNLEDTILKTNLEAVHEIAYQLRLRNCGGIIILDLIDMEKEENKQRVYRALEEALKKDRARPTIMKISDLGLVEMTRKRTRDTIIRSLCESCAHCEGKGFIKSKQTVAYEVMRDVEREGIERDVSKILIQAHPEVIDILAIDERETMDQMERRYRKQIYLQAAGEFHPEQFEVVSEKRARGERGEELSPRESRDGRESASEGGRDGGRGGRGKGRGGRGGERGAKGGDRNSNDRGGSGRGREREAPRDAEGRLLDSRGQSPGDGGDGVKPINPNKIIISSGASSGPVSAADMGSPDEDRPTRPSIRPAAPRPVGDSISSTPRAAGTTVSEGGGPDDFFDEEDRLAFLRAQAAQDAALASLNALPGTTARIARPPGAGGGGQHKRGPQGQGGAAGFAGADRAGGGRGGRNSKRRRGGRGRYGGDRGPDAGRGPQGGGDGMNGGGKKDGGGDQGGGDQGGGDHSQPPV